ncbi:MAG: YdcH family protein [Beijerinckiaceae bacterium]
MSVESHLAELERRHQLLEREIEDRETHPAEDPLKIAELKRKKLKIRDEISKIQTSAPNQTRH